MKNLEWATIFMAAVMGGALVLGIFLFLGGAPPRPPNFIGSMEEAQRIAAERVVAGDKEFTLESRTGTVAVFGRDTGEDELFTMAQKFADERQAAVVICQGGRMIALFEPKGKD